MLLGWNSLLITLSRWKESRSGVVRAGALFGHRVVDGANAARFLRLVVDASEEPFRLPEGRESRLNSQPPLNKICYRLHDGRPLCKKPSA